MGGETDDLDKRFTVHEAVCAERWAAVLSRMGRVERILIAVGGSVIVGMAGIIMALLGLK